MQFIGPRILQARSTLKAALPVLTGRVPGAWRHQFRTFATAANMTVPDSGEKRPESGLKGPESSQKGPGLFTLEDLPFDTTFTRELPGD